MKHCNFIAVAIGLAFATALSATPAAAQRQHTYVSGHGNDSNTCIYAAPCRTFAGAYVNTNPGGEITVLDPAGYGQLFIDKAISINNDGVGEAGIVLVAAGNAFTINAGVNDAISLRGLSLDGGGIASTNGIQFISGKSLTITNTTLRHFGLGVPFTGNGIVFAPIGSSALTMSHTIAADNGANGIFVVPFGTASTVTASFNHVEASNNSDSGFVIDGANATGTLKATAYDSVASGNGGSGAGIGFFSFTTAGQATTSLSVFHSVAAGNSQGIISQNSGATLRIGHSMITHNNLGWAAVSGGVPQSYNDNDVDGNGSFEGVQPIIAQK